MKKTKFVPKVSVNSTLVDFRSNATIGNLRMVIRYGGHSMYIGLESKGSEINREEAKVLIPLLRQFVKDGKFK